MVVDAYGAIDTNDIRQENLQIQTVVSTDFFNHGKAQSWGSVDAHYLTKIWASFGSQNKWLYET